MSGDLPATGPSGLEPSGLESSGLGPSGLEPSALGPSGLGPSGLGPSGLGPMGDLHLIAAALRVDRADVASYARVLTATLGDALPPGMVRVERHRSVGDRLAGREGKPVGLVVTTADQELELRQQAHGEVAGEIRQIVHQVVIKRRSVGVDEWLVALAGVLTSVAERSAAARAALAGLLGD